MHPTTADAAAFAYERGKPSGVRAPLKPCARARLFVLYGVGGRYSMMRAWCRAAPAWLEVRPIELPGRGLRKGELMRLGDQCAAGEELSPAAIAEARHLLIYQLADEVEPLLDRPFGLFGFSHGGQLAFLLAAELRRRRSGADPPFVLCVSARGALHTRICPCARLRELQRAGDEELLALAHSMRQLPATLRLSSLGAADVLRCYRSDMLMTLVEVGPPRTDGDSAETLDLLAVWAGGSSEPASCTSSPGNSPNTAAPTTGPTAPPGVPLEAPTSPDPPRADGYLLVLLSDEDHIW